MTFSAGGRCVIRFVLLLVIIGVSTPDPASKAAAQGGDATMVDLSRVPVPPSGLPEKGFRFTEGAPLNVQNLVTLFAGFDASPEEIAVVDRHFVQAHFNLHQLFSEQAITSDTIASLSTLVIEAVDDEGVEALHDRLFQMEDQSERIGDVLVSTDVDGGSALLFHDEFLIAINYSFSEQQISTRHNAGAWSAEALADLATVTAERIDDAVALSEEGAATLGTGNIWISGPLAMSLYPTRFSQVTEHYRVLDGDVLPYPGETDELSADEVIPGVSDLFFARQGVIVGDRVWFHVIGVTLARFGSEADAAAYARAPDDEDIPGSLGIDVSSGRQRVDIAYGTAVEQERGTLAAATMTTPDGPLSGYRSVRRAGEIVQVVEWLAGGTAQVNEAMVLWLADQQEACVRALPDPCAVIPESDLLSAGDGRRGAMTPEPVTIDDAGNGGCRGLGVSQAPVRLEYRGVRDRH